MKLRSFLLLIFLLCASSLIAQQKNRHVVQEGETKESIAKKYNITVAELKDFNPDIESYFYVGLKLNIPEKLKTVSATEDKDSMTTSKQAQAVKRTTPIAEDSTQVVDNTIHNEEEHLSQIFPKQSIRKNYIDNFTQLLKDEENSLSENQKCKIINLFEQYSESQKNAILNYLVQNIIDSLKAGNKPFAINCIDYYRLVASPDNEYLGSLVVTEGKYYYDLTDTPKLSELTDYITGIAAKSKLDYSSEIAELSTMKDNLMNGCDNMLGYWCVDDSHRSEPPFYLKIEKVEGHLVVSLSFPYFAFHLYNISPDVKDKWDKISEAYKNKTIKYSEYKKRLEELGVFGKDYFIFKGDISSLECVDINPNTLSFFWASQKIKKGNEYLATGLRSGVRSISNDFIGEFAKSNTYDLGTSVAGSLLTIFVEAVANTLIDGVSESKNTIRTICGTLTLSGKNAMNAHMYADYFHASTEDSKVEIDSCECNVKLMRYDLSDPYISENIAFYDYFSGLKPKLRQYKDLSSKETKQYLSRHPEAKIKGSSLSEAFWEKIMNYNKEQYAKLREYVRTH